MTAKVTADLEDLNCCARRRAAGMQLPYGVGGHPWRVWVTGTEEQDMKIAGLFAGIGGIELGFHNALGDDVETTLLCEWWDPAKAVLGYRFPDTELHPDVRTLIDLPADLDVLTAGFPCTDLSQAGRTAGIKGKQSGLVSRVFEMLAARRHRGLELPLLMIENVPNMLTLDRGAAMRYLIAEIEALGYTWAYRVVDSRSTGLPQRRRRVILVASTDRAPKSILFADEAGDRSVDDYAGDAFGFYWTEGKGGLGWAVDAVPTLKGGSTIGIASPPAIWLPTHDTGRDMVVPTIEDAEVMQGFTRGWTDVPTLDAKGARRTGTRWKLVGNAVTTRIAEWLAGRVAKPGDVICEVEPWNQTKWPLAAAGSPGRVERARERIPHPAPLRTPTRDRGRHDGTNVEPPGHRRLSQSSSAGQPRMAPRLPRSGRCQRRPPRRVDHVSDSLTHVRAENPRPELELRRHNERWRRVAVPLAVRPPQQDRLLGRRLRPSLALLAHAAARG